MSPALAVLGIGFRATTRSSPIRAAFVLAGVAAFFAPLVVAFAFSGADALAVSAAFGTAALFAPVAALFAGVGLASGDRGGDGLAPALRGAAGPASTVAAAGAGCAAAAAILSIALAAAAAIGLAIDHREFSAPACAGAIAAGACAALPAASAGVLIGASAPRALAGALAVLVLAAATAGPVIAPGSASLPGPGAFLLARDAAFGELPAGAVLLSCVASFVLAAAAWAATVAVLRGKDLVPAGAHP